MNSFSVNPHYKLSRLFAALSLHHNTTDPTPLPTQPPPTPTPPGMLSKKSKKKSAPSRISTDPVQGCRDFPPEEMRTRSYLFAVFREISAGFGFQEYDAPVLEPEELYLRKGGEEITKQMYNFVTKSGHRVALRPEMTPSLARLVLGKGPALSLPAKWFSLPQCWRHEDITRGRRREHYQWNADILGVKGVGAEADLIAALCAALSRLQLSSHEVVVRINSRQVLQGLLQACEVPNERFVSVCVVLDKRDKITREEMVTSLGELELSPQVIETLLVAMELPDLGALQQLIESQPGYDGLEKGTLTNTIAEVQRLFKLLEAYGLGDWVVFDPSVVRGLAYYTGVVFEVVDRPGKFRAICGGGRYDALLTTYGAPTPMPACGFGFGDCVILELLKEKKKLPALPRVLHDVVIPFDESMREVAVKVVTQLRAKGRCADLILEDRRKVRQGFAYADSAGAERAVLVAPEEWAAGRCVTVKYLREGPGKVGNRPTGEKGHVVPLQDL